MERIRHWVRKTAFKSCLTLRLAICNSLNHNFPVGLFLHLKKQVMSASGMMWNPLFMFMVLQVYEMGVLNWMGQVSLLLVLWKFTLRLKHLLMPLGTLVWVVILHLCQLTMLSHFIFWNSNFYLCPMVPPHWGGLRSRALGPNPRQVQLLICSSSSVVQRIQ